MNHKERLNVRCKEHVKGKSLAKLLRDNKGQSSYLGVSSRPHFSSKMLGSESSSDKERSLNLRKHGSLCLLGAADKALYELLSLGMPFFELRSVREIKTSSIFEVKASGVKSFDERRSKIFAFAGGCLVVLSFWSFFVQGTIGVYVNNWATKLSFIIWIFFAGITEMTNAGDCPVQEGQVGFF